MRLGLRSPEQRLWLPLITALAVANINGVVILAIFLVFLLPLPAVEDRDAALQTNLIALAGLLAAASPIALIWVRALWWPILRWLRSGSPPRDKDRRRVLRAPARVLLVPTAFWASGVVLFTLLNTAYSWQLALSVGIAIGLGGGCRIGWFLYRMAVSPENCARQNCPRRCARSADFDRGAARSGKFAKSETTGDSGGRFS